MKIIRTRGLHKCPVCGGRVQLRKNASKEFQVKCTQCEAKTGWMRKTDAVIQWYTLIIQYLKNKKEI